MWRGCVRKEGVFVSFTRSLDQKQTINPEGVDRLVHPNVSQEDKEHIVEVFNRDRQILTIAEQCQEAGLAVTWVGEIATLANVAPMDLD